MSSKAENEVLMGFGLLIKALKATNDPEDVKRANTIAEILKARGEDISLSGVLPQAIDETIPNIFSPLFVLRDKETDVLTFTSEKMEKASLNNAKLQTALSEITHLSPYYFAFADRVPVKQPEPEKKKRWFGKKVEEKTPDSVEWERHEKTSSLNMQYKYRLFYKPTDEGNKMEQVQVLLGSQHDEWIGWENNSIPKLIINFSGSELSAMWITFGEQKYRCKPPYALLELTKNTPLGLFLKESFVFDPNTRINFFSMSFTFGKSPSINVEENLGEHISARYNGELKSEYIWSEIDGVFDHIIVNPDFHNFTNVTTKPTMDIKTFADIAKSTLSSLVPIIDVRNLNDI